MNSKGSLYRGNFMVKEHTFGSMERVTKGNSSTEVNMGRESGDLEKNRALMFM